MVQFHRPLGGAIVRLVKLRQTQINLCRIQCIQGILEPELALPRRSHQLFNQTVKKILKNLVIPVIVGVA